MEDVTPYKIEVFAYIGLAYFDGVNDGTYTDPYIANYVAANPSGFVTNLNSGNYPNLYPAAIPPLTIAQEVGNLVKVPVSVDVDAYPGPNYSFRLEDDFKHLPVNIPTASPKYGLPGFDFAGTITPQEEELLADYGKVFFYEVHVYDNVTNAFVMSTLMHPAINTLPNGITPAAQIDLGWKPVDYLAGNHVQGDVPTLGYSVPLYYFYDDIMAAPGKTDWDITRPFDSNLCNSREVVFDVPMVPHEVDIDGTFKLWLGFSATGQTGWVNSALHLTVGSK